MSASSKHLRPIREPVPIPEPGADIGVALRQLMMTLRQTVETGLRARGIDNPSFVHGMLMKTLAREPGLSGAQLARRTAVTAQSMNGLLRGLEKATLLVREKHPENRRTDCWFLTAAGLKQLETATEVVDGVMARIRSAISKADSVRLVALLEQCAAALGAEEKAGR
jgi:DNA-binding MarR family transcriptional regulator